MSMALNKMCLRVLIWVVLVAFLLRASVGRVMVGPGRNWYLLRDRESR